MRPLTPSRIGDVARRLNVETHVIRFWETQFGAQLRPRCSKAGQRWYEPHHVELLAEIHRLLYVELYTIAGAKRQLRLAAERQGQTG